MVHSKVCRRCEKMYTTEMKFSRLCPKCRIKTAQNISPDPNRGNWYSRA